MTMTDVVFCKRLLRRSETFVIDQFDCLPSERKRLISLHQIPGSASLPLHTEFVNHSRLESLRFELSGQSKLLTSKLASLKPRVVHAHFANQGTQLEKICAELSIPLVISCHGRDVFRTDSALSRGGFAERLWRHRRRRMPNLDAHYVAVSHFVAAQLESLGVGRDRINVISNPLDIESIPLRLDGRDQNTVLLVGRLVEKKGVDVAIEAISQLAVEFPEIRLRILGDGSQMADLRSLAGRLPGTVEFLGAVSRSEVLVEMSKAAVLLVPSRQAADGDSETFGVVAAEAQATGLPVVVTPHGGLPEVVLDGVGGIVAKGLEVRHVSAALAEVMRSAELRRRLGKSGRVSVQSRFNSPIVGAAFDDLYAEVGKSHAR